MSTPIFIDYNFPEIEQINSDTGRTYKTHDGFIYPSVTTVLSVQGNEHIDRWREKVGEETATRITQNAAKRGTKLHEACENTLKGKEITWGLYDQEYKEMFTYFVPVFDNIKEVYALETRMSSKMLKVAGTADLICDYDGVKCILDWKTSSRFKSKEDIPGYFMQMSTYAVMFYEHTGIVIPKICIQMAVADYGLVTYWENTKDWIPKFKQVREEFKRIKGY